MKKLLSVVLSISLLTATVGVTGVSATSKEKDITHSVIEHERESSLLNMDEKNPNMETQGVVSWTYKAFKNAMRTGGWLLSEAVKPFSKKNADWIRNNSKKIADIMDRGEQWTERQFSTAFQAIGAPKDVADSLAKFIITIL